MGYYTEISDSQYSAKDTALQNRLNGVNGHTILGATLSSNVMGIFGMVTSFAGNNNDAGNDVIGKDVVTETFDTQASSHNVNKFTDAMLAFNKNQNEETAKALQDAYNADPNNATISRYYPKYKADVEKLV